MPSSSSTDIPNTRETVSITREDETAGSGGGPHESRAFLARPMSIFAPTGAASARTRLNAPSKDLTLDLAAVAIYEAASRSIDILAFLARWKIMERRVSNCGGRISAIKPQENLERSRSSNCGSVCGD